MLLYQGQLDVRDGVAATEAWLANWSWTGTTGGCLESPRKAWKSAGIAGYYRSCNGLTADPDDRQWWPYFAPFVAADDAPTQTLCDFGILLCYPYQERFVHRQ